MFTTEAWQRRISALKNIPSVVKLIWEAGPLFASLSISLRICVALMPVTILWVSNKIVDHVIAKSYAGIWNLLWLEFGLATTPAILNRTIDHCDALLVEQFAKHMSLRIMTHCTRLDLATFEDSAFADQLERAREQSTGRLDMLAGLGRLTQSFVTVVSLAAGILYFSRWLLMLLLGSTIPAFLGESYFAFLGYALSVTLTPYRRKLDYIRQLGASSIGVKEIKIFGLGPFLTTRYREIADECIQKIRSLQNRRLLISIIPAVLGSAGYYGSYLVVVLDALGGKITIGQAGNGG